MTLPTLLWRTLNALELAYAEELQDDQMPSLDTWANLLRVLNETGVDSKQLPSSLRISKRAVRMRVSFALRKGWIVEVKFGRDQKFARLTPRGIGVSTWWKAVQHDTEVRWPNRTDRSFRDNLRAALEKVVIQLPLELPHYPASYGAADASVRGGNGQDWKPVFREPDDVATPLPLSALLSQVIVAFAMSYEEHSPVAFALSTNLLKQIPTEGRAQRELGHSVGISALQRHGFLTVSGSESKEFVRLTARGRFVRDAYDEQIAAVQDRWGHQFGHNTIEELHHALAVVVESQLPH